jgi:NADH dehydrogenase/NADH:ubiquinone oxidoreductase subunit G
MSMIQVTIAGKTVEVEPGTTVLEAAKAGGVDIPTLCFNPMVSAYGVCKVCVTEIVLGGQNRVVPACTFRVREPMEILPDSEATLAARRASVEKLLARWPNVPVIKDLADLYGAREPSETHPLRDERATTCILCGLCIRACREVVWEDVLSFSGKGDSRRVVMRTDSWWMTRTAPPTVSGFGRRGCA